MSQRCELAVREPAANRPRLIGWFPYLNEVNVTHFRFAASCQTQHTVVKKFRHLYSYARLHRQLHWTYTSVSISSTTYLTIFVINSQLRLVPLV